MQNVINEIPADHDMMTLSFMMGPVTSFLANKSNWYKLSPRTGMIMFEFFTFPFSLI